MRHLRRHTQRRALGRDIHQQRRGNSNVSWRRTRPSCQRQRSEQCAQERVVKCHVVQGQDLLQGGLDVAQLGRAARLDGAGGLG